MGVAFLRSFTIPSKKQVQEIIKTDMVNPQFLDKLEISKELVFGIDKQDVSQFDLFQKAVSLENASKKQKTKTLIQQAMKMYERFPGDTGSTKVQIAVYTVRILSMMEHYMKNKKDYANTKRLVEFLYKRRRMLKYLKSQDLNEYFAVLKDLNLTVTEEKKYQR